VLPAIGAAIMAFVVIYSVVTGSLNGVEEVWGLGLALLGLILSSISSRVGKAPFYSDPSVSHGDTVEAELAGAEAGAGAAAWYPTHRPEPGVAEQQPGDWLNAFTWVTLGLAQAVAVERWQAVGLSASCQR
jgi:hypothetical protein